MSWGARNRSRPRGTLALERRSESIQRGKRSMGEKEKWRLVIKVEVERLRQLSGAKGTEGYQLVSKQDSTFFGMGDDPAEALEMAEKEGFKSYCEGLPRASSLIEH